jgi:hypothetical protein
MTKTNILPVITLYQPWATWIMRGWKTIETRTHDRFASLIHKTLLIHAGLHTDGSAAFNSYLTHEQIVYNPDEVINGAILGSVYVDACGWLCGDPYENKSALIETTGRYGLFLTDIKKFDNPILIKGEMGIWYYDIESMAKVRKPNANNGLLLF